ncbi:nuclear condensing complex subunit [Gorgonomyces haynaldii]|nr:nuclear condensing complex subunit [Gorgonomyces haynaldii]
MVGTVQVFQNVVESTQASHRKNAVHLLKAATSNTFEQEFLKCLYLVLQATKQVTQAQKVIKFLGVFMELQKKQSIPQIQEFLNVQVVEKLLMGIEASNKTVRQRSCQLLSVWIEHMDEMDGDLFEQIKNGLLGRLLDKDTSTRQYSVMGLCLLIDGAEPEEQEEINEHLLETLRRDTSADVRKSVVANIDFNEHTMPSILERVRDVDKQVRSTLFQKLAVVADWSQIESEQAVAVLVSGLSDRDPNVKTQAESLVMKWFAEDNQFIQFVGGVDLRKHSDSMFKIANVFFKQHPQFSLSHDDIDWYQLSAEGGWLIYAFIAYCSSSMDEDRIEALVPNLSFWVTLLDYYKTMVGQETTEFVVLNLLKSIRYLNLSDETGRQRLFTCLRQYLVETNAPTANLNEIVDTVKMLSINTEDFLRVVLETNCSILSNVPEEDELLQSLAHIKILEIVKHVLEVNDHTFDSCPVVFDIIEQHVFPLVSYSRAGVRRAALECLAMYALTDSIFGSENLQMFVQCAHSDKNSLIMLSLQFFSDWILQHSLSSLGDHQLFLIDFFGSCLENSDEKILALAVEALSKMFLWGRITDTNLLMALLVLYFHPGTLSMTKVRQCLVYFFSSFPRASYNNQKLIQDIFCDALIQIVDIYSDLAGGGTTLLKIGTQMAEWTNIDILIKKQQDLVPITKLHTQLAMTLMQNAVHESLTFRKLVCQMLAKLDIDINAFTIEALLGHLKKLKKLTGDDTVCRNAIDKFMLKLQDFQEAQEKESQLHQLTTGVATLGLVEPAPNDYREQESESDQE